MTSEPVIGFVILSYEGDGKLGRLVRALNREYSDPPIVVHHDFSQSPIDERTFPSNVQFVKPSLRTSWGKWAVTAGALKAFDLLFHGTEADWAFLLSAADYPVMRGAKVREELRDTPCDAFIDMRPVKIGTAPIAKTVGRTSPRLVHFESAGNHEIRRRWTHSPQWWIPIIRFRPRLRIGKWTFRPPFDGRHPYRPGFECFHGDHWFTANRRAVSALLNMDEQNARLCRHLRSRPLAEESYYATILASRADLIVCLDNRRFTEWHGGGAHPMTLTEEQVPEMLGSGAFFARKFPDDPRIFAAIDAALANPA